MNDKYNADSESITKTSSELCLRLCIHVIKL